MAFDKEEKEFLQQMFSEYDKKQDQRFAENDKKLDQRFAENDKKLDQRFAENNTKLINGIEEMIDYKISEAKDDINKEASKRHNIVMNTLDSFAGEINTTREERETQSHQIIRNTRRIEKLEKAVYK